MRVRVTGVVAAAAATLLLGACTTATTTGVGVASSVRQSASAPDAQVSTAPRPSVSVRPPRATTPDGCAHNALGKRVIVDVSAQHAWFCAGGRTTYQTPVTTGAVALPYDSTPLGTFHVQGRDTDTALTLADGSVYHVHYWVPFQAPLFGFHDAGWQTIPFGSPKYRTQGSHGCVHLPMAAMSYLYHWVSVGTVVTIRA